MTPDNEEKERFIELEISADNPNLKSGFERIGKSLAEWKKDLENERRKARAYVDEQRRKRGFGSAQ